MQSHQLRLDSDYILKTSRKKLHYNILKISIFIQDYGFFKIKMTCYFVSRINNT